MFYLLNENLHDPRLVSFPVETIGTLFLGRSGKATQVIQDFSNAPAAAAALRVFSALLMHGSPSTKAKAAKKARDLVSRPIDHRRSIRTFGATTYIHPDLPPFPCEHSRRSSKFSSHFPRK